MNRDDVIRWAREAGLMGNPLAYADWYPESLERFAALVAAAERNRAWTQDHWTEYERSIAAAEREACAQVCEAEGLLWGNRYAAAIRARGQA